MRGVQQSFLILIQLCRLPVIYMYSKTCFKRPLKKRPKMVFKTHYRLMQIKKVLQNAPREHPAILLTCIKLPSVIKTFDLFIFEWPLQTGFTVFINREEKSVDPDQLASGMQNYYPSRKQTQVLLIFSLTC